MPVCVVFVEGSWVVLTLGEWLPHGVVLRQELQRPGPKSACLSARKPSRQTSRLSIQGGICGDHYCLVAFVSAERLQVLVIDQFNDPDVKEIGFNH